MKADHDRPRRRRAPGGEEQGHEKQDGPVLPEVTADEREVGWGDEPSRREDEWYLRERPPHHE